MDKKKKLGIWKTVKLVITDARVGRLMWLIAKALLDDGKIDHVERLAIRNEAMNIIEGIITGGR